MNARNGKIARLPREIRDELNERLERSEQGPQVLVWLNALKEVKKLVKDHFDGIPISKQNLSEWRQGGFQEWLARRDLCEEAREVVLCAEEMGDCADGVLADAAATVLAARFGSLITHWDGEVDEKFEAKSRVLNRLCRSVVQLQRGMHRAWRENFELQQLQEEKEKAAEEALKDKLVAPLLDTLKVPAIAGQFGGGEIGRKIARYITAIQRGDFEARLKILPTDKYEADEPAKPAPPQPLGTPANEDNTLETNEIDCGKEEGIDSGESEPVKPNQTDLAPVSNKAKVPFGSGIEELQQVKDLTENADA